MSDVSTKILDALRRRSGGAAGDTLEPERIREVYYRAFVDQTQHGIVLADGQSGQIIEVNRVLLERLELRAKKLAGLRLEDLFARKPGTKQRGNLAHELASHRSTALLHLRERRPGNALVDVRVRCALVEVANRRVLVITSIDPALHGTTDIQLLEDQKRLDHLAHHDQLTGLPNRHYLAAFLPRALKDAKLAGRAVAILFIDLDHFKHVNDSRGHETGDRLLQEVARRIAGSVEPQDTVVRMGGDEFIVVLPQLGKPDHVQQIARRINRALDEPIRIDGHQLVATASIGVSLYPRDGADMGELLKHSDSAMYEAKETGRNKFQMFRPEMIEKVRKRATLENAMRAGIRRNEFDVVYQPIIDLRMHRVAALEALVRWMHPTHGMIMPDQFIDVAEDSGLIVPIGNFVLRHVMQDLCAWRAARLPLVPVSVNVAAAQLKQGDLANVMAKLLAANDFAAELIELELTERAMFVANGARRGEPGRDMISELRASGVRIAIDDFGTGYSSLSYLKHWRVDKIKIDRSFIRDLVTDFEDYAIVSAIFAIARQLRIEVVAEGIESYQQVQKLQPLGCRFGQGYLFARPQPAEECIQWLRSIPPAAAEPPEMMPELLVDEDGRIEIPPLLRSS